MRGVAACLLLAGLCAQPARAQAGPPVPANLLAKLDATCSASAFACDAAQDDGASGHRRAILSLLEQRLRDTDAVTWLDKIALNTQVDEFYARVQRHHESGGAGSLGPLRRRFDELFDRVLAMVRRGDPPLYRDIRSARPLIWAAFMDSSAVAARAMGASRERALQ